MSLQLSQGEYVAPEKIENVYGRSRFISQVFVYGDSFESFLVALVLLDNDFVKKWASGEGSSAGAIGTDAFNEKLREAVLEDMIREGKKRGLMSFEQVKAIDFFKEAFYGGERTADGRRSKRVDMPWRRNTRNYFNQYTRGPILNIRGRWVLFLLYPEHSMFHVPL